ncbi:MAG: HAD family hydrolase [Thermoplasmata archaeon]
MKAVFLDSGGVITRLQAPKPDIFLEASRESGIDLPRSRAEAAFRSTEAMLRANQDLFLSDYPQYRARYMDVLRAEAGLGSDLEEVYDVYMRLLQSPRFRSLHGDVLPTLRTLRDAGLKLGVLSNASKELIPLLFQLGIAPYFDAIIVSQLVGYEKPQREIFLDGLEALEVSPEEAAHVGDSYHYDYLGATQVGMTAILLDRAGSSRMNVSKVRSLYELPEALNL